jgi:hypothetical protein
LKRGLLQQQPLASASATLRGDLKTTLADPQTCCKISELLLKICSKEERNYFTMMYCNFVPSKQTP